MITDLEHVAVYAVLAVIAVFLQVVGLLAVRYSKETTDALRQWSKRNGWSFTRKEPNLTERWTEHPIRGSGAATNIVRGQVREGDITCFTHKVTTAVSSTTTSRVIGVIDVGTVVPRVVAAACYWQVRRVTLSGWRRDGVTRRLRERAAVC